MFLFLPQSQVFITRTAVTGSPAPLGYFNLPSHRIHFSSCSSNYYVHTHTLSISRRHKTKHRSLRLPGYHMPMAFSSATQRALGTSIVPKTLQGNRRNVRAHQHFSPRTVRLPTSLTSMSQKKLTAHSNCRLAFETPKPICFRT